MSTRWKRSVGFCTTVVNATNDAGQSCVISSGVTFGLAERTYAKWIGCPSTSVMNCGSPFSAASAARQSYPPAQ